jgi:hypothetical protein
MTEETKKDEALKADEGAIEEESPVSEESEGEVTDEAASTEEAQPESEGEEAEPEPTGEEEAEVSPKEEGRKTAQSRIRELNAKKKAAEEKVESLAEQVKKLTSYRQPEEFIPQNQASQETDLTYEELMRRQDALIQLRLAQQENVHRVQTEAVEAIKSYPELDPDSDSFDSELSESVSQAVLAKVQADPTASVTGFVGNLMKPYRRSLEKQAAGQKETLTKQVSEQAMRPTQVQEQEKPFSELSIEEMEEKLGVVHR